MTNKEFNEIFRKRTLNFALKIILFLNTVPIDTATRVMNYQLCKAATSVGANFRAFTRGRSKNERFSKICIVVEEADETIFWLELFNGTSYGNKEFLAELLIESEEIMKVTGTIKDSMIT